MTDMSAKHNRVTEELKRTLLFFEICKFGLDVLKKCYDIGTVSRKRRTRAVEMACEHSQLDVIEHFASQLSNTLLIRYIEQEYQSNRIENMNQLLD